MIFGIPQSLQNTISVLFRYFGAYIELAEQDLAATKVATLARLQLVGIFIVSALFALLMICVFVIALTWDSHYRLLAIGLMAGFFLLSTIVSGAYLTQRRTAETFGSVRREWQQDRVMLHRLLSKTLNG